MAIWTDPKTDWKSTDRFNILDYNRIKNNLEYLYETESSINEAFSIDPMGSDITDYTSYWDVDIFNLFESNLEKINKNLGNKDYGASQRFFYNGPFIKWDELNRIESAIQSMYKLIEGHIHGLRKLSFRLGAYKEVKV